MKGLRVCLELLTSPLELAAYKKAITEVMFKGTARNIESDDSKNTAKKHTRRVSDEVTFTRLFYYGTVQMSMSADDFWLCSLGLFIDLWACHKQSVGIANPKVEVCIDDIILEGI